MLSCSILLHVTLQGKHQYRLSLIPVIGFGGSGGVTSALGGAAAVTGTRLPLEMEGLGCTPSLDGESNTTGGGGGAGTGG